MSKNTEKESDSAYAVPSQQDDMVTTVCRIVQEQSPEPMRGMKKTNKVPNAAEKFSADHHGEYEARSRQSSDRIGRVHRHNQACPKLYDELDKRRSASRGYPPPQGYYPQQPVYYPPPQQPVYYPPPQQGYYPPQQQQQNYPPEERRGCCGKLCEAAGWIGCLTCVFCSICHSLAPLLGMAEDGD